MKLYQYETHFGDDLYQLHRYVRTRFFVAIGKFMVFQSKIYILFTVLGVTRPLTDEFWSEISEFFRDLEVSELREEVESVRFLGLSATRDESYGNLFSSSSSDGWRSLRFSSS